MANFNKCVVKIAVSSETDYFHIDDVVYYRSGMSPDFVVRWMWYFEYLAALVKVNNPRRKVEFYNGPQDVLVGKEWHEYRRGVLLKSRMAKLKKLEKGVVDDDLFHFKSQDNEAKKQQILAQIDALNRDEFPFYEFPEYINKIKQYVQTIGARRLCFNLYPERCWVVLHHNRDAVWLLCKDSQQTPESKFRVGQE